MAHFITYACTGCTACTRKCPAQAIDGEPKARHIIDPGLCIDCAICGNVCPKSAVLDPLGDIVPRLKLDQRLKPSIDAALCTGCEACISVCPQDCISMAPASGQEETVPIGLPPAANDAHFRVAHIDLQRCIGCGMCESLCIKEAITRAAFQPVAMAQAH